MRALALAGMLMLAGPGGPEPLQYRLEAVKSKVIVTHELQEHRAVAGEAAVAGDALCTGFFARAVVTAPTAAARFEVLPRSEVVLAGEEPGVLLSVHKGVVKAIFDAVTSRDDRIVATPGALLAVRGTRYGVDVDSDGVATLAVFEGVVEVRSRLESVAPILVHPGEQSSFGPRLEPRRERMPSGWSEEKWRGDGRSTGRADEGADASAGPGSSGDPSGARRPDKSGGPHR